MITNRLTGHYPGFPSSGGGDEESLQTDVMRFMAILGLCLTAVFALVQGLASSPPPADPQPRLPQRLAQLTAQLQQVNRQLQMANSNLLQLSRRNKQQQRQIEQLKRVRQESGRVEQPLRPIAAPPPEQRLPAAAGKRPRQPPPDTPRRETVQKPPPQKGLVLRFASQQALQQLIRQQRISFLAIDGKAAWKIGIGQGDALSWSAITLPERYNEMAPETVPETYKARFFQQTGAGQGRVTWGVVLPVTMTRQLMRIARNRRSGTLLIGSDGAVSISGEVL